MVDAIEVIADIQRRYALDWDRQAPLSEDMVAWAGSSRESEMALYDAVAAELARGYFEKRYSFDFCDAVVNQLYGFMLDKQTQEPPPPWPKLFWRVFEAFDAGELATRSAPDPVKTHTDPEIADIVRELGDR